MANEGAFQRAEILVEQGDQNLPFFVVISGAIEILRPNGNEEELITVHTAGQFMGDVETLSGVLGARADARGRGSSGGQSRGCLQNLVQSDADLAKS